MEENNSLAQPEQIIKEQPKVGFLKKFKIHKFKILGGVLGIFIFLGAVFGAYKFKQGQVWRGEKIYCQEPRPEVCTMECIQNPPYICGSDGNSYCSSCQACANKEVDWYLTQDSPCTKPNHPI